MTMTDERRPFTPLGEMSRRELIHAGLAAMPPLEAGTLVTHDMIAAWLDEPFPIPRKTSAGFLVPDYGPMNEVNDDLLESSGVLFLSVANVGYRVATDDEKAEEAERLAASAQKILSKAGVVARSVHHGRVAPAIARRVADLARDVQENLRVLRAEQRARARAARQWTQETE